MPCAYLVLVCRHGWPLSGCFPLGQQSFGRFTRPPTPLPGCCWGCGFWGWFCAFVGVQRCNRIPSDAKATQHKPICNVFAGSRGPVSPDQDRQPQVACNLVARNYNYKLLGGCCQVARKLTGCSWRDLAPGKPQPESGHSMTGMS
jgi:hypothetical protein